MDAFFEPWANPQLPVFWREEELKMGLFTLEGSGAWPCYFKFPSSLGNCFEFVCLENSNLVCSWFEPHHERDAVRLYYSKTWKPPQWHCFPVFLTAVFIFKPELVLGNETPDLLLPEWESQLVSFSQFALGKILNLSLPLFSSWEQRGY